jgi:hypothetical protein
MISDGLGRLERTARKLDEVSWAPNQVAERALGRLGEQRRERAAGNAVWAEIQARRVVDGGGIIVRSDDVGWKDLERQDKIARAVTPDPLWVGVARRVERWQLRDAVRAGKTFLQRGERGWGERDTWDLGTYLARVTGGALAELAETTHSWPGGKYASFDEWQGALRARSEVLLVWGEARGGAAESERWWALVESEADEDEIAAAWEASRVAEEEAYAAARAAMKWGAKHLDTLWD